jgi:hypothetical protein
LKIIEIFYNFRAKRKTKVNPRRKRNHQGTQRVERKRGVGMSRQEEVKGSSQYLTIKTDKRDSLHKRYIYFLIVGNLWKDLLILKRNVKQTTF